MIAKSLSIALFFTMFIVAGFNKIGTFTPLVKDLQSKTSLPNMLCTLGILGTISLEIFGSLIIVINSFFYTFPELLIHFTFISYLIFMVLITFIYHPPFKQPQQFLKNLSIFAAIFYFYIDFFSTCSIFVFLMGGTPTQTLAF